MTDLTTDTPTGAAPTGKAKDGKGKDGKEKDGKEKAKEVASTGADQAKEVAGTAKAGAKDVAAEASRQAGELASQASTHALEAVSQASGQFKEQAAEQTGRAAEGMRSLSGQLQALTEGRPDEAGAVGDYARQAQDKLQELAGRLDDGGFDGLLDDVQRFARRRPGLFLLGAGAAGFAAGRLLRGSKAVAADDPTPASGADLPPRATGSTATGPLGVTASSPTYSPGQAPGSPGSL